MSHSTDSSEQQALLNWLASPETYPHQPDCVEHLQTHISHVFLAGEHVYKLKKPVHFDFLDFSTPSAREFACQEELRLNRRLARDIYVDVVPISRKSEETFCFGRDGEIVDWLVQMRRLPTEHSLEALYQSGKLQSSHIELLIGFLVPFYSGQPAVQILPHEYRERFIRHVQANGEELRSSSAPLPPDLIDRVHGFQLQLLALEPELFDGRVKAGRVVDGHGDLRPEHICFANPLVIFDCIEFNAEFRQLDVVDELAFLAAECDYLGANWVGTQLLQQYSKVSDDQPSARLWGFYKCYRACVRAKVADLRGAQTEHIEHDVATNETLAHLQGADRYAAPWLRPILLAVGGMSGTGKSTLARSAADALGARLLRTDVIRQELFPDHTAAPPDAGIYALESRERVYAELMSRAAALHSAGVSVVLDGTFSDAAQLHAASQIVAPTPSHFLAIECVCRSEVAKERIEARHQMGQDASEANVRIYEFQREHWQPWPTTVPQIQIDTEVPIEKQWSQVLAVLRQRIGNANWLD